MSGRQLRISVFGDEIASGFEEQAKVVASEPGVDYIELRSADGTNIAEMGDEHLGRIGRVLRKHGLGVSAIGSPIGKAAITGDFDVELERFKACADAAAKLQTPLIRIFSFYIPDGQYGEYRDEVLRRLTALADQAAQRGLTLVHENESYIYGDTPERCVDILTSVGSEALQLTFDPANFVQVGVNPATDAWPVLSRYVKHFHVKDAVPVDRNGVEPYPSRAPEERLMASVRPAGEGAAGLETILRSVLDSDYDGFLTLEPHLRWYLPDEDGASCFRVASDHLRRALEKA